VFLGPLAGVPGLCPANTLTCAAPTNPYSAISTSDTKLTYDSYAAFAQGDYKLNNQLKATVGVRYTTDTKSGEQYWRFEEFDVTTGPLAGFNVNNFGAYTPALDITALAIGNAAAVASPGVGLATYNATSGFWQRHIDATWSAWTGNAGFNWTPDATTLAYFKYSRGYKTGRTRRPSRSTSTPSRSAPRRPTAAPSSSTALSSITTTRTTRFR
jgi:outer membrane receptor protein involved in Fe transport